MKKGGDGTHVLNAGDKGWNGERAQVVSMPRGERVQRVTSESGVLKRRATTRRSRYVVHDEEDEEQEEEDQSEQIKEELVGRRSGTLEKTSDVADKGEASAVLESQEGHTGPSTIIPISTQADPSISAQADNLLLNAVDPNSVDGMNIARLLGAAEVVGYPNSPQRTAPGQRSVIPKHESNYEQDEQDEQDEQRQSPLFLEEDLDLESEASIQDRQEQTSQHTSSAKKKGKGRQGQWQSAHEADDTHRDERSTVWE